MVVCPFTGESRLEPNFSRATRSGGEYQDYMRVRILTKSANMHTDVISSFGEFCKGSKSSLIGTATNESVYHLLLH